MSLPTRASGVRIPCWRRRLRVGSASMDEGEREPYDYEAAVVAMLTLRINTPGAECSSPPPALFVIVNRRDTKIWLRGLT